MHTPQRIMLFCLFYGLRPRNDTIKYNVIRRFFFANFNFGQQFLVEKEKFSRFLELSFILIDRCKKFSVSRQHSWLQTSNHRLFPHPHHSLDVKRWNKGNAQSLSRRNSAEGKLADKVQEFGSPQTTRRDQRARYKRSCETFWPQRIAYYRLTRRELFSHWSFSRYKRIYTVFFNRILRVKFLFWGGEFQCSIIFCKRCRIIRSNIWDSVTNWAILFIQSLSVLIDKCLDRWVWRTRRHFRTNRDIDF